MPLTTLESDAALVLIDLQNGIVNRPLAHDAADVIANAAALADAFREHGRSVVLVTVTGAAPGRTDAAAAQAASRSSTGSSGSVAAPAGAADIVPQIRTAEGDIRIVKQRWGAFTGTDLHERLQDRGVGQVVLAGVASSIGVESTARSAHELGYHVVLVADAMTDTNRVAHDHSVSVIFPRLGEVATTAEVIAAVAGR